MRRLAIAVAVGMAVILSGCDRKDGGDPNELEFYCAAGLRPPVAEIVEAFYKASGVKVACDYAGSETLLSKIKLARRGDLYMPGDAYYMHQAEGAKMIARSRAVCYWVPTILVQKGNPRGIASLADLLKDDLKVGLGDPNICAIGKTTWKILGKNGITHEQMENNLKFQSLTVNELGMQIQAKSLDAVIVWDAMASYYRAYGDEVPIPAEKNVFSVVLIGVLEFSKNKGSADEFVEFMRSDEGRGIFAKYDYETEPPK